MTLFKYDTPYDDAFSGLENFFERAFQMGNRKNPFEGLSHRQVPVDLHSDEEAYYVQAELPGVNKKDVHIEMDNAVLEIRARRSLEEEGNKREISFSRRITVGDDINVDRVKARLEDGILTVTLPKSEARKPKAIKVA